MCTLCRKSLKNRFAVLCTCLWLEFLLVVRGEHVHWQCLQDGRHYTPQGRQCRNNWFYPWHKDCISLDRPAADSSCVKILCLSDVLFGCTVLMGCLPLSSVLTVWLSAVGARLSLFVCLSIHGCLREGERLCIKNKFVGGWEWDY